MYLYIYINSAHMYVYVYTQYVYVCRHAYITLHICMYDLGILHFKKTQTWYHDAISHSYVTKKQRLYLHDPVFMHDCHLVSDSS